jgi:hypothetical protein
MSRRATRRTQGPPNWPAGHKPAPPTEAMDGAVTAADRTDLACPSTARHGRHASSRVCAKPSCPADPPAVPAIQGQGQALLAYRGPAAQGGSVASAMEMSLLLGGSKATARGGSVRLRPIVMSVKTAKEDTMATMLLDYSTTLAKLHIEDLRREAEAARKVQAARAARRQRRV